MKQKILAVLMIIAVLLCFMPTMAFAGGETSASQIGQYYEADDQNSGELEATPSLKTGETVKKYETQKIADGQVRIDKTIAGTGTENVFDVTLKVTTEDVDMQTVTSKDAAVVLVIDTSNSMVPDGSTSRENRIEKAKEAAQAFINNFADADSDAARKVAIVKFSGNYRERTLFGKEMEETGVNGAETVQGWTDANKLKNMSGLCSALASLKADGGTNLAAGIQLAKNLLLNDNSVVGITNKNIVVLTDGAPTFGIINVSKENGTTSVCADGTNMKGTGNGTGFFVDKTEHDIHTQAEEIGTSLMQTGISPYAIFLGNEKLYCNKVLETGFLGFPTKRCDLDMSGRQWLATRCGFTAYAASDVEKLTEIFQKISELIKYQAQAWILTDPMGKYVDCLEQYTDDDANKGINFNTTTKELSWNLKQADPTSTNGKQKTYELTYRIKLNNLADGFQAETYYATNKPTSLTYLITNTDKEPTDQSPLKIAYFNVPSVRGLKGSLSFTKVDETGNVPLAGAQFTLTATDNANYVLQAQSDEDGKVVFKNIPSGHTYTLKEITSPAGYAAENDYGTVTVSYGAVNAPAITAARTLAN